MSYILNNLLGLLTPFNQLLLLQKFFTTAIILGIKKIIPDYTNDDEGMYKLINYYGKNKENLSKLYFFLSLFAKQLNYGDYDEKHKKIIEDIKNRFLSLIDDIYKSNNGDINKIIKNEENIIKNENLLKENIKKPTKNKKTSKKSKISKKSKSLLKIKKTPKTKNSKLSKSSKNKKKSKK